MQHKIVLITLLYTQQVFSLTFNGIIESGITKNNFLCTNAIASSIACHDANTNAQGVSLHSGETLQIFNDQAYWFHQKAKSEQYAMQVQKYDASELQNFMQQQGWGCMGGFCIIISSNPVLTNQIQPDLKPDGSQEKVVAQLWYAGAQLLQLWSQDAKLITKGQPFQILLSNTTDPLLIQSASSSPSTKEQFLQALQLQQKNRDETVYNAATDSPRSIKIQ